MPHMRAKQRRYGQIVGKHRWVGISMGLVGIVYGAGSGIMLRVIVPDDDKVLDLPSMVGPGEAMLRVDRAAVRSVGASAVALEKHLGFKPPSGRTAVVKDGVVEDVIIADPALYSVEGKTLVACPDDVKPGMLHSEKDGFKEPVVKDEPVEPVAETVVTK